MTVTRTDLLRPGDPRSGREGAGDIGGRDLVVRAYHKPTGLLVEVPTIGRGHFYQREVALDMLKYGLAAAAQREGR